MKIATWNIEAVTGYKPITTFFEDFSIADAFGESAIRDTYKRGLKSAKFLGYKELTEFVMALNWKIWEHHGHHNDRLAHLYDSLWRQADEYAVRNLKGDELAYYYMTTD